MKEIDPEWTLDFWETQKLLGIYFEPLIAQPITWQQALDNYRKTGVVGELYATVISVDEVIKKQFYLRINPFQLVLAWIAWFPFFVCLALTLSHLGLALAIGVFGYKLPAWDTGFYGNLYPSEEFWRNWLSNATMGNLPSEFDRFYKFFTPYLFKTGCIYAFVTWLAFYFSFFLNGVFLGWSKTSGIYRKEDIKFGIIKKGFFYLRYYESQTAHLQMGPKFEHRQKTIQLIPDSELRFDRLKIGDKISYYNEIVFPWKQWMVVSELKQLEREELARQEATRKANEEKERVQTKLRNLVAQHPNYPFVRYAFGFAEVRGSFITLFNLEKTPYPVASMSSPQSHDHLILREGSISSGAFCIAVFGLAPSRTEPECLAIYSPRDQTLGYSSSVSFYRGIDEKFFVAYQDRLTYKIQQYIRIAKYEYEKLWREGQSGSSPYG